MNSSGDIAMCVVSLRQAGKGETAGGRGQPHGAPLTRRAGWVPPA